MMLLVVLKFEPLVIFFCCAPDFRKVYNKEIQDLEQPLLVHRPKDKEQQKVCSDVLDIQLVPP